MTGQSLNIRGMPYFPGVARGRIQRGTAGDLGRRIVLIDQQAHFDADQLPLGLIVCDAAPFSHRLLGLLGLGVPTVLITAAQAALLPETGELLIDGSQGLISDDASDTVHNASVSGTFDVDRPPTMADGGPVYFSASVRHARAAVQARTLGACSIGLVRSEFLQPADGRQPDKDFYLQVFRDIAEAAGGLTVTVRLLDVACDKLPDWLPPMAGVGETLGLQGVRVYGNGEVTQVIEAQLSALAELSNTVDLRVLLPYLVRLEEFEYWRSQVRQILPAQVPVGTMAETPASVLDIDNLLASADFVAIGCNDLMQSLFAADRDRHDLRHYLDPYAPPLFRLFRQIAQQAGQHIERIQLCGLLPQIQGVLPVLLGLGFRHFSVDAPFIPHLAAVVLKLHQRDCESLAIRVCNARTTRQVLQILQLPDDRHAPFLY